MDQIFLGVFGVLAVWYSQDPDINKSKWACILGMCSQPFWFYSSIQSGQLGIFVCTVAGTVAWARGIHQHWFPTWRAAFRRLLCRQL